MRSTTPTALAHIIAMARASALMMSVLAVAVSQPAPLTAAAPPPPAKRLKIAALTTVYYHNSHADVIIGRLIETDTLDGQGKVRPLEIVSLYVEQDHERDLSRGLAEQHGFRLESRAEDALTLGTGKLAVDGVLLVAEHGKVPINEFGQWEFPKRRLFEAVERVFRQSGRVVPVYIDKHLSHSFEDAKYIYDVSRELKIPLMAGSSIPGTWRRPALDMPRDAQLKEIVVLSYHLLDVYGFHALEAAQALAERRQGGETGVKQVRACKGDDVWKAGDDGLYDRALLDAAYAELDRHLRPKLTLREAVKEPELFTIDYHDGLRMNLINLNGAIGEWSVAWRTADDKITAFEYWTQEERPFHHFSLLVDGVEQMMLTGKPSWPVERTLLTSGILDASLHALHDGQTHATPQLEIRYQPTWSWQEPPAPPPGRPLRNK